MLRRLLAVLLAALLFFFGIRLAYAAMDFEEEGAFHYYIRDNIYLFDQYDIGTAIPTFQSSNSNDFVTVNAIGSYPDSSSYGQTWAAQEFAESYNLNTISVSYLDGTLYPGLTSSDYYSQLSIDISSSSFFEVIDTSKTYLVDIVIEPSFYTYFLEPFENFTVNLSGGSSQILAQELYSEYGLVYPPITSSNVIYYRSLVKFDNLNNFNFSLSGDFKDDVLNVPAQYRDLSFTVNFNLYEAIDTTEESTTDWLEKIYNALTGGGDTPATNPAIDNQIAAGQSSLDQIGAVEDEIVGDFQTNVGAIAPESYALPSQALTGISWIGSIMTSVWNGLGDFQALITFPCIVALALVFIGRFSKLR